VVSDTAANMTAAGCLYPCPLIYCAAHTLELTSGIGFNDENIPGAEGTMKPCRAFVSHFSHSSQATKKLLGKQFAPARPKGVLQDVATRWWSTYAMTNRLLEIKGYLHALESEGSLTCNLTGMQWVIVELVRNVLKPFMIAQKLLEDEKYITISFVPGIIYSVRQGLKAVENDENNHESIKVMSRKMLVDFCRRWGSGDEMTVLSENETEGTQRRLKGLSKLTLMAAACDPRTKFLMGILDTDKLLIWQLVYSTVVTIAEPSS
jgi:zinc finger BED domain-containing protein 1 (E3 SUMO-protein ligase ZBED1)